jgi:hypothetical protein
VWPVLPHAFPLFEALFPETAIVRADMAAFLRRHLKGVRPAVVAGQAKDLVAEGSDLGRVDPSLGPG